MRSIIVVLCIIVFNLTGNAQEVTQVQEEIVQVEAIHNQEVLQNKAEILLQVEVLPQEEEIRVEVIDNNKKESCYNRQLFLYLLLSLQAD